MAFSCYGNKSSCGFQHSLKRVLALPVLWAGLAGLAASPSGAQLPSFMGKILEPLAAANAPLAMLTLGSFLQLRYLNWKPMTLAVALRMGVGFALGQLMVLLAHLQELEFISRQAGSCKEVKWKKKSHTSGALRFDNAGVPFMDETENLGYSATILKEDRNE